MKRNLLARTMLLSVLASALLSFTACKSDEDKCVEGDQTACLKVLAKAANNMKSALDATESKRASGGPLLSQKMQEKLRSEKISSDELAGYSKADLRILRNAIFASHGYIFKSDDLKEYFAQFDWYNPLYKDVSAQLSVIEKKNIATIKAMEDDDGEGFRDSRDGKTYRYVKIGKQTWMAENLNYKTQDSYCPMDKPANCKMYGRLYTWNAALKACPKGWRLPSKTEWETMITAVGGSSKAGKVLKSKSGWNESNGNSGNGTDDYGFSALAAGGIGDDGVDFLEHFQASFWSSTEYNRYTAYHMVLNNDIDNVYLESNEKTCGFSIRCVKD